MTNRFSRTKLLMGSEAMAVLERSRVALFGIGGVGGYAAEALARSGVGALDLVDHDVVSPTNINRQIVATTSTIGKPKVEAMASRVLDINPRCKVTAHRCFFLPDTASEIDLSQFDYIVDAVDTVTAKLLLIQSAHEAGVPIISSMGTANKFDPTALEVADIYDTSICPLAKIIRKECRKRGVKALKVVYSKEPASPPSAEAQEAYLREVGAATEAAGAGTDAGADAVEGESATSAASCDKFGRSGIPGSNAFVPPAAGLILAREVVMDLIATSGPKTQIS